MLRHGSFRFAALQRFSTHLSMIASVGAGLRCIANRNPITDAAKRRIQTIIRSTNCQTPASQRQADADGNCREFSYDKVGFTPPVVRVIKRDVVVQS